MAGKFKVDQDEVEVDQLLRNLDKKKDAYIRSQNWDAEQQKAFSEQYNKIRAGIADGTVSGRNSDRSYVDSSQSFQNAKEGYDSVGEVFRYVDQILDARPSKSSTSSTGSKKKYSNNHLLQKFVDYNFGGNTTLDMKAWEAGDLDEATGTYKLDNRKARMIEFLQNYRDNLGDDFDYSGSAYKDADDLKGRLDSAILAMQTTEDWNDELGRLGFGEEFRSNMFRTKSGLYQSDDDLLKKHGLEWAIDASPEQKAEVLASIKAGKTAGTNANYDEWKKKQNQITTDKEWDDFVEQSKKEGTFENNIAFGGNINDEYTAADLEDISKAWNNLDSFTAQNLQKQFATNLGKYMSGDSSVNWDEELQNYYKQLMQGNSDFKEENREGDWWDKTKNIWEKTLAGALAGTSIGAAVGGIGAAPGALIGSIGGGLTGVGQAFLGSYDDSDKHKWADQAMLNEYRTLVQMGHNKGQVINPIEGNKDEFFVPGAWNLEKKEFYTYNPSTHTIHKHKLHESDILMKEYRKVWEKEREKTKKMQQGGVFDAFMSTLGKPQDATDPFQNKSVSEIKEEKRQKAGERVVSEDLQPEDFVRFGAMAADVTALVASFAPGYGTAASGVLSLGSTAADLTADIMDDSVSAGQVFTNLGANLGMAVLGLIPGGKSAKIAGKIAKYAPKILAAATAANLALNDDIHKSIGKLTSDEKLTVNDWKNIGIALSSVSGLTRSGKAAYQARKFKSGNAKTDKVEVEIKGKGKLELTTDELAKLNKSKSNKEATDYLVSLKKHERTKGKDGKEIDLDFGIKEGRTWDNLWGLRRGSIKGEAVPGESLNSERIALEKARIQNANTSDDSSWWKQMTTGDVRLATDYEMYEGSLPIKGIKMPDTGITKWFKDLVKDDFAEQYRARQKQSKDWLRSGSSNSGTQAQATGNTTPKFDVSWEGQTQVGKGKRMHYRVPTGKKGRVSKEYLDYLRSLGIDPKTSPRYAAHNTRGWLNDPTPRKIAFEGSDGNIYYWKDGGIVKAQQGTQTKRRNVINNGADWNKHIWGSRGLISTLSGIQANEEDLKLYNDLQNSYSKLGFTDVAPGDNLTYNQDVANYQGTFENLTNINGGTIAGLIQQGVLKGRGGSSDKTDLWKGDGLAGTQTWLRHLGTNFTSKDQLAKYNEMGLHKDIEAFINPETNMVNFRLRKAPTQPTTQASTPTVATQPLRASTTPNNTSGGPVGTGTTPSGNTNQPQTVRRGPKQHQIINDMRYLLALRHNDRTAEKAIEGLNDAYTEPGYIQKHLRVQNNLSEGEPYVRAGEKVRQVAEQNKTADATTNALLQLSAQSQDNDYNIQRNAVLDKNVETQKAAALAQEHANQDVVHAVNEERKTRRGALAKAKSDILLGRDYQNWKATDLHMQGKSKQAYEEGVARDAMAYDNYDNDQKVKMTDQLNVLKNQWLSNNPGKTETDWIDSDEYKYYRDYANAIRRYRSGYYGIDYTPVAEPFDPTWNKKGGKVEDRRSRKRIETTKMVNKSILEQVKNGDKRLDRFSKVTQKAILKALGL